MSLSSRGWRHDSLSPFYLEFNRNYLYVSAYGIFDDLTERYRKYSSSKESLAAILNRSMLERIKNIIISAGNYGTM
jgi:hypothetical protein